MLLASDSMLTPDARKASKGSVVVKRGAFHQTAQPSRGVLVMFDPPWTKTVLVRVKQQQQQQQQQQYHQEPKPPPLTKLWVLRLPLAHTLASPPPLSQRPQVSQTITVGSSFSCSTPRSSSSGSMPMSGSMWTPSRVTKAGGLGRGSNPLDSFFPFDPYLLRRSHAYVAGMYNSWKVRILTHEGRGLGSREHGEWRLLDSSVHRRWILSRPWC